MRLFGFGLHIESDVAIAGSLRSAGAEPIDLFIKLLPPKTSSEQPIYRFDEESLIFSPAGVAEYRCTPKEIRITPEPGCDTDMMEGLLIATALPAIQWMHGHFMLHAATMLMPGNNRAIAIAGPSGAGKSSLAAELMARGASLVADDSIRLCHKGRDWMAAGLPGGLFCRVDASEERQFLSFGPDRSCREAAINAILVLGERGNDTAFHRLDGLSATTRLLAQRHRPRIPAILQKQAEMLDMAAGLAKAVPVYSWQRRAGYPDLEQMEWDSLIRIANGEESNAGFGLAAR